MRRRQDWAGRIVPSRRRRAAIPLRLLLILVMGMGLIGSAWFFVPRQPAPPKAATAEPPTTVMLGKYLVNLADTNETHYLQMEIALEVTGLGELGGGGAGEHGGGESEERAELPLELTCRINDAVVDEVSAYKFADLVTAAGKQKLKAALKTRIEECLTRDHEEAEVHEVLFVRFVMQ